MSFDDVFGMCSDDACKEVASMFFDDRKLTAFSGEIFAFTPDSVQEKIIRTSPFALRCYLQYPNTGVELDDCEGLDAAPCGANCSDAAYIAFNEDHSQSVRVLAVKEKPSSTIIRPQGPVNGPGRPSVAATIEVDSSTSARDAVISLALRKLNQNGSFSDAFLDLPATVVTMIGKRRYRVILKFKAGFA